MSRYIDADALCEEMKQRHESAYKWYVEAHANEDEGTMAYADSAMAAFIECKLTIDKQPTADVAPVVHGRWIQKSRQLAPLNTIWWHECSECGGHAFNDILADYCPYCGASMTEGAEDAMGD